MKSGDMVKFTDKTFNHWINEEKIGILINVTDEPIDPIWDHRKYAIILSNDGKLVKTYSYTKISY